MRLPAFLLLVILNSASGFQPLPQWKVERRRNSLPVCSLEGSPSLDRKTFLAAALAYSFSTSTSAVALGQPDKLTTSLSEGMLRLSNQIPYGNAKIALFSDGSDLFTAAKAAVEIVGAQPVLIDPKQDLASIRAQYAAPNCLAAIVPDLEVMKKVMEGEGIVCESCGFPPGRSGPKWFIVLNKTGKTGPQMQEEANILGRECDKESGLCFQIGKNVPVYTLEELATVPYVDDSKSKRTILELI